MVIDVQMPSDKPFIACALATYRADELHFLKEAVSSVLTQTSPPNLFVIVVDGSIPEETQCYLECLSNKNPSVVLLKNEVNLGLAASMNVAIDFASEFKPKYFFRMDADDICHKERFSRQVEYLENHEHIDVLGSSVIEIDEDDRICGSRNLPLRHHQIVRFLPKRCSLNHPSVVIRFSVFNEGHRYHVEADIAEDYRLWIDLARSGYRFANIREPLLNFRCAKGFFDRRGARKAKCEFKARLYAMESLNKFTFGNILYALLVFIVRFMPSPALKVAYKLDRLWLQFSNSKMR